jgi:HD superfamily phosphodiesterase
MNLQQRMERSLTRPIIELGSPAAAVWKARADELYARWPTDKAALRDDPDLDEAALVVATEKVVEAALAVIAAHPPALPCHGVTHTIRVLSHGLRIARRDGLSTLDAMRLELAAATHDLGRLLLHYDGDLRHADVSAVLIEELRPYLGLPDSVVLPARHAVLMHSARRTDHKPIVHRVIDDVRSADKLDALDDIGFIRAVIYQGPNHAVDIRPHVNSDAVVLYGWWKNIEHVEPVLISRTERYLIAQARKRSRAIGESIKDFSAPADTLTSRFLEAVALVEPDANRFALARTLARLERLPRTQRATWAGLLTTIVAEVRRLEAVRLEDLDIVANNGRPDLAPLARRLLRWSHRVQETGADMVKEVAAEVALTDDGADTKGRQSLSAGLLMASLSS